MNDARSGSGGPAPASGPEVAIDLGIDIGGTKALAIARADGRTVWSDTRPTGRSFGPARCVELVAGAVDQLDSVGIVRGIGIGVPGLVDATRSRVRSSVIVDGWDDVPLAALVSERTGHRCHVDNDVNNAARAELAVRQNREPSTADLLFVAVGTGIGGALVLGGKVWAGVTGMAGEVGHMVAPGTDGRCDCGRRGCVAVAAGGRSIETRCGVPAGTLGGDTLTPVVLDELQHGAERLGEVVADAMNLLNLPLVVIGGGVAERPGFVNRVERSFRGAALSEVAAACRVEPAWAGYGAGALGAALLAASA